MIHLHSQGTQDPPEHQKLNIMMRTKKEIILQELQQQKVAHSEEIEKHKKENEEQATSLQQQKLKIEKLEEMMKNLLQTQFNPTLPDTDLTSESETEAPDEPKTSDSDL